ncbi:MAG: septum formation initiator family protein [Deltaproteobacteria bacterium]|nr:septum formation initiator family protein [Candidatus Zymogenaceae bacterium]
MTKTGRSLLITSAIISLVIIGFTIFGDRGLFSYLALKEQQREISNEVIVLEEENRELTEELIKLENPVYLERVIRSTLGMIRPGETVYIFPSE